jgi:hypothetical protein
VAVTTVGNILTRAKKILQEVTSNGTRWANTELLDWLNEGYAAICNIKPNASSVTAEITCAAGTRQSIPEGGLRLLEVVRNITPAGGGLSVILTTRGAIDSTRRRWHAEQQVEEIEQYIFDEAAPRQFYVYPPAMATSKLEIIYSSVPDPHAQAMATDSAAEKIRLDDSFAPVLVDYILSRAYAKDAEHAANLNRATMHFQMFQAALGMKVQTDRMLGPLPVAATSQQQVPQQ